MKQLYFFLLLFVAATQTASAQCTITATTCDCASQISGGVLTGDVTLDGDFTLPATIGGCTITGIGPITIRVTAGSDVIFGDALTINGSVQFTANSGGNATLAASSVTYTKSGTPSFADLAALLTACANDPNCTTVGGALPVSLLSWDARKVAGGVSLQWASTEELDNDFYLIEHSSEGTTFTELARVSGQANSSAEVAYEYMHEKPAAGTHFYRLCQQDFDGTRRELGIRRVELTGAAELSLSPNPTHPGSEIVLSLGTEDPTTMVNLYSMVGKVVASYPVVAGQANRIQLPASLPAGVYLVRTELKTVRLLVR